MKPEKFDGRSSFETFMCMFENCARYNKWNSRDKAAHLRWSLTGTAAQLLWNTESLSYENLVEKLRDRFGGKGMEERFQTELRCRRRAKGESLRELAQDIRRLMALAYPGEKSSLGEHIARDAFLSALDDADFELKIREREPADLDSAVKIAQRYEVFKAATEASSSNRHRVSRRVTEEPRTASDLTDLEVRMTNLEAELKKKQSQPAAATPVTKPRDRVSKTQQREERRDNQRQNRAVSSDEDVKWKELIMKKLEALEATRTVTQSQAAPTPVHGNGVNFSYNENRQQPMVAGPPIPVVSQPTVGRQPNVSSVTCWNCGQQGHVSRNCTSPRTYVRGSPAVQHGRPTTAPQPYLQPVETADVLHVSGAMQDGHVQDRCATYLHARVGSCECDCLLDTGSETSLIPSQLVDQACIVRTSQTLKAANGTPITVLGKATLPLRVGNVDTEVTGLVSDHVAEVMLGIEWITANGAIWDFTKSSIWIGGEQHRLRSRNNAKTWIRRVYLQEDVQIPPRAETNLITKVAIRGRPDCLGDVQWSTESTQLAAGVRVARTLIPTDRFAGVPVRAVNLLSEPITIKAGTLVADLHPVSVVHETEQRIVSAGDRDGLKRDVAFRHQEQNQGREIAQKLIDQVHGSVSESTMIALHDLLMQHADVFSQSENDLGCTTMMTHSIDTGSARPVRQQLRRYPPAHLEAISKHVDDMLRQGVIEPASSPWASNVVLVRKKDGSYRCCIDYRQLNLVTRRDAYPLPRIDACLDALGGAKWFSTFDLRSSYHQVPMNPEDQDKTAFICHRGMFRFKSMPFGLVNAGATFQRLMDVAMAGLHLNICLVYLDDIIVFSETEEEHLERVKKVLERIRVAGLKLKPEKCTLMQKSVSFLGHVVSGDGISTDPEKIRAVTEWPTPSRVKDVRSFLGLASYYRRFVRGFATLASPLHNLMKKGVHFEWTEEADAAFQALKAALTSPPILAMPTDAGQLVLDTDASDVAIGAVLSQKQEGVERVIAYASRSLDKRERNYCVTRKELLAVVHFMKYFRQYLLGREFKVRTDHAALSWLRHTPEPIGQQARWLEQMEEFSFTVEHRPGSRHSNADAMSRRPCPKDSCACNLTSNGDARDNRHVAPTFGGPADHPTELLQGSHNVIYDDEDVIAQPSTKVSQKIRRTSDADITPISRTTSRQHQPHQFVVRAEVHATEHEFDEISSNNSVEQPVVISVPTDQVACRAVTRTSANASTVKDTAIMTDELQENGQLSEHDSPINANLPWSLDGLRAAQREDADIGFVIQLLQNHEAKPDWETVALQSKDVKTLWSMWPRLAVRDGLLKRRYEDVNSREERWQVVCRKHCEQSS
jgi:hypothetical protein